MAENKENRENKTTKKAYTRYASDPVFLGLIILSVLLLMSSLYFAGGAGCPPCPTGNAVGTGSEQNQTPEDNGDRQNGNTQNGNTGSEDNSDKLIIYEFSEFQCPYCSAAAGLNDDLVEVFKSQDPNWEPPVPKIKEEYGNEVEVQFKHFIVHETAMKASEAAECARDQGKFWEMHDILFENQQKLEVSDLKGYAADLGLDTKTFNACLDSGDKESVIQEDVALGKSLGVSGTPTFVVGGAEGYKIVGAQPFANFQEAIENALDGIFPEPPPEQGPSIGTFQSLLLDDGICTEDGKPIIRMYTTTWCPHCTWIKDTFDSTIQEYVDAGKVVAHHWELDTNDDTLTSEVEDEIPDSEIDVYETFNPRGTIPTYVFGCKYYRVGNGYERQDDLGAEAEEFKEVMDALIEEVAA